VSIASAELGKCKLRFSLRQFEHPKRYFIGNPYLTKPALKVLDSVQSTEMYLTMGLLRALRYKGPSGIAGAAVVARGWDYMSLDEAAVLVLIHALGAMSHGSP